MAREITILLMHLLNFDPISSSFETLEIGLIPSRHCRQPGSGEFSQWTQVHMIGNHCRNAGVHGEKEERDPLPECHLVYLRCLRHLWTDVEVVKIEVLS